MKDSHKVILGLGLMVVAVVMLTNGGNDDNLGPATAPETPALTTAQLLKHSRIDCNDPSDVLQKSRLADKYDRAYTQAIVEIKDGVATYYAGAFDETELDEIAKVKVRENRDAYQLSGANHGFILDVDANGKTVIFVDKKYGTEWRADHCQVSAL
ncbi:hypothetical protein AXL65_02505 [Salmonella enterica subsp. enterica]|nr:hypothetical protein [Salmonella enterica subsp. enterica]